MKVFISWSGERSREIAFALKEWIPMAVQHAQPWVSEKDIAAGERWSLAIAGELETSNFGIICVTPDNLKSEWLHFEAGALSKFMTTGKVVPLLFGLDLSSISGPLSQFQAKKLDQRGMLETSVAINAASSSPTDSAVIERLVPSIWPVLNTRLGNVKPPEKEARNRREVPEILEEVVTTVRAVDRNLTTLAAEVTVNPNRKITLRQRTLHLKEQWDIISELSEARNDPQLLLFAAGLIRDDFPWVAEVLIYQYRSIITQGARQVQRLDNELIKLARLFELTSIRIHEVEALSETFYFTAELLHNLAEQFRFVGTPPVEGQNAQAKLSDLGL